MIPRTFAAATYQINLIVITAIASTLTAGSLSIFNFANNLQYFPIGIIGVSFAVAIFPALSRAWAELKKEEFIKSFSSVFRQVLYLVIPVSILIFVLRNQIIGLVLKHGQFTQEASRLTAASLGLFCLSIFTLSLIPLIFRAFFALQDTKTPTLIAVAGMAINIILSFYFVWLLDSTGMFSASCGVKLQNLIRNSFSLQGIENIQVLGLPLAFSFTGIPQIILLMFFLYRKIGDYKLREIFNSFLKILIASILMAVLVCLVLSSIPLFFDIQTFLGTFWQTVIAGLVGVLTFLVATFLLKSPEIEVIKFSIIKKFRK